MYSTLAKSATAVVSSRAGQVSIFGILTVYCLKKLTEYRKSKKIRDFYAKRIEVARKDREEALDWARQEAKLISDEERIRIEKMTFMELKECLQSGTVACESAVRVYIGLALKSHEKTNCLTNIIKESLSIAREFDERAKDSSFVKPPLFGMPISIKDSVELAGYRCTWGLAQLADEIPKEDTYPVMRLREAGMIPFCQTNIPTSCMAFNCSNTIYGTTCNPFNPSRTCGGSSGGEGAIIGSKGSLIGIGSDIGGSVRIPAAYSGCCSLKPSATRFSCLQGAEPIPMRPFLMPTEGPMAQDPHALVEVLRSIWSDYFISDHDALSVPINFRENLFKEGRKLRIGYYTSDGFIEPMAGNKRAVLEAVELLKSKGHSLVPFSINSIANEMADGLFAASLADGGVRQSETLKDEPLSKMMSSLRDFGLMPLWQKKLLGWAFNLIGDNTTSRFFSIIPSTVLDFQAAIDKIYACRKEIVRKMKNENIDLLLCPPTLSPALPHALPTELPFTTILSTVLWNAMDFPAGVLTTSKWTEEDEKALESYEEKGLVEKAIKKGCKGSVGLPLAVQFVAPAFRDETVLRAMVDLYEAMRN